VQTGGSSLRPASTKSLKEQECTAVNNCNPSYTGGRKKKIAVQGQPQAKGRSYLKITLSQKGWDEAQVIE
jgi:hypothetical protein